jgi:hypothetical protein
LSLQANSRKPCVARSAIPPGLRYSDHGFRLAADAALLPGTAKATAPPGRGRGAAWLAVAFTSAGSGG